MKKIISKIQFLSETQAVLSLCAIGATLFLTMFFLMPPTVVTTWEEVGVETHTVKTLSRFYSKRSGTKVYVVVETPDGKFVSIPVAMTDDIRAGDSITFSIERSKEKKPNMRYTMVEYKKNRKPTLK